MKEHNLGIIGLNIGRRHLQNALKNPHVASVAIADNKPETLQAAQTEGPIRASYNSWEVILEDKRIDAVIICLPNYLHAPVSIAAMESGKHVLCEKPPALTSDEVEKIISVSKKTNQKWMTAFNNRFNSQSKYAKECVQSGELGDLLYGKAYWTRRRRISWRWFADKHMAGGGPLMDIGVHMLDLVLHLMDFPEPQSISGSTYRTMDSHNVEDIALGFVRFKNGQTLFLETAEEANVIQTDKGCQIIGKKQGISLFPLRMHSIRRGIVTDTVPQFPEEPWINILDAELDHFLECIREDKELLCLPQQALIVMRIIEAIYESSGTGKEVIY